MACVSMYALTLNSTDLSGNIILNYVLSNLTVIPQFGILSVCINHLGRKYTLASSHICLGILCIGLAFIPKEQSTLILVVYLVAYMASGISMNLILVLTSEIPFIHFLSGFSMVYLITTELYPTNLRVQAVGLSSAITRIFCACAPFLGPLAKFWQPLPMLIIGAPIILSGILVTKLPETYNEDLPQTIKGAIELEEKQQLQQQANENGCKNDN